MRSPLKEIRKHPARGRSFQSTAGFGPRSLGGLLIHPPILLSRQWLCSSYSRPVNEKAVDLLRSFSRDGKRGRFDFRTDMQNSYAMSALTKSKKRHRSFRAGENRFGGSPASRAQPRAAQASDPLPSIPETLSLRLSPSRAAPHAVNRGMAEHPLSETQHVKDWRSDRRQRQSHT